MRLAPCVMMPVRRIFFCRSIWNVRRWGENVDGTRGRVYTCLGTHLDPGVPVLGVGAPSVDQALVIEAGEFGTPALQTQDAEMHRRGGDL